jgi:multidrug transporter EmrE-like cation transporter
VRKNAYEDLEEKEREEIMLWFWFVFSGLLFAFGEYMSKRWALTDNIWYLCWMSWAYGASGLAWAPIIKARTNLAQMGTVWALVALACTVGIGVFMFKEKLSWGQWSGIVLAGVAVVLISKET